MGDKQKANGWTDEEMKDITESYLEGTPIPSLASK